MIPTGFPEPLVPISVSSFSQDSYPATTSILFLSQFPFVYAHYLILKNVATLNLLSLTLPPNALTLSPTS